MKQPSYVLRHNTTDSYGNPDGYVEVAFDDVGLGDILVQIEQFLKGCGFACKGSLDFIQDDYEVPDTSSEEDSETLFLFSDEDKYDENGQTSEEEQA